MICLIIVNHFHNLSTTIWSTSLFTLTKTNKLNWLAGLSLAQLSPSLLLYYHYILFLGCVHNCGCLHFQVVFVLVVIFIETEWITLCIQIRVQYMCRIVLMGDSTLYICWCLPSVEISSVFIAALTNNSQLSPCTLTCGWAELCKEYLTKMVMILPSPHYAIVSQIIWRWWLPQQPSYILHCIIITAEYQILQSYSCQALHLIFIWWVLVTPTW